jgi:hypothetical protein
MPFDAPKSLRVEEVNAVTAYLRISTAGSRRTEPSTRRACSRWKCPTETASRLESQGVEPK